MGFVIPGSEAARESIPEIATGFAALAMTPVLATLCDSANVGERPVRARREGGGKRADTRSAPTVIYGRDGAEEKKASMDSRVADTVPCWKAGLPPPRPFRAAFISLQSWRRSPPGWARQ